MKSGAASQNVLPHARKILRFFAANKEKISPLLILTHDYPDPDSLASAFALSHLAQHMFGISCRIVYGGIIGRTENRGMVNILQIPAYKIKPADFKKFTHAALLDTQPAFENNSFPKNRRATIVIDQHPVVQKPDADLVILDPDCGATSVILGQALLHAKIEIPSPVATALAYGITSDTLNLYRAGRPDIIQTYLGILPYCDLRALGRIQHPQRSRHFFTTLGRGIQNAMMRRGLIVAHLGPVESPDFVSQTADFLLTYKNIQKSAATGRYKGKLHVSLRISNPNAEAGEILRDVFSNRRDAGGHNGIAGGSFYVGQALDKSAWEEAERTFVERLLKRLRINAKGDFHYPFR